MVMMEPAEVEVDGVDEEEEEEEEGEIGIMVGVEVLEGIQVR
jgi:hypothetical protein